MLDAHNNGHAELLTYSAFKVAVQIMRSSDLGILARVRQQLQNSAAYTLIDVETHKALLRFDGLVIALSDQAYAALKALAESDTPQLDGRLGHENTPRPTFELAEELTALEEEGVFPPPATDSSLDTPLSCSSELDSAQPQGISLLVSQTCNLNCAYCYAGGGTYGSTKGHMDYDTAIKAVEHLLTRSPDRNRFIITFFGGEPLANYRLIRDTVEYCNKAGVQRGKKFRYSITTNGTLLTDEIVEFLKKNRFAIMVSLDPGPDVQNRYRPFRSGDGSYDIVRKNIGRLVSLGFKVQMRSTVVREMVSREAVATAIHEAEDLGVARLFMSVVDTRSLIGADLGLRREDKRRLGQIYMDVTWTNIKRAEVSDQPANVKFDPCAAIMNNLARGRVRGVGRCGACHSMAAVSTSGKIYPCHRFVGMESYAIGDVGIGIDCAAVGRFFREAHEAFSDSCADCWARRICSGMCYHHIAKDDGTFTKPDEDDCMRCKDMISTAAAALVRVRELTPEDARRYVLSIRSVV